MSRAESEISYINPYTRNFLTRAIKEGAHLIPPPKTPEQEWVQIRNIAGSYFASPGRLSDIGRVYASTRKNSRDNDGNPTPLTGGAIGFRVHAFIERLHINSSPALRKAFPLGRLSLNKRGSKYHRLKMSERKGGVAKQVADQLTQGQYGKTVLRQYDLTTNDKAYMRSRLREMGLNIPLMGNRRPIELERGEKPLRVLSSTDPEIQKALDELSMGQYLALSTENPPVVTTAIKLAQELGYHFPVRLSSPFIDTITAAQIPLSIKESIIKSGEQAGVRQRRFIVWIAHTDRIKQAYEGNPNLSEYKNKEVLEIVCGPELRLPPAPIINQYRERLGFIPASKALRRAGVSRRWTKEGIVEFFGNRSPVTLIRAYDTLYCHQSQFDTLKRFADQKTK
ncbi:hypothetical protein HYW44_02520 [Candidatus Daviesbacteria bacterium]|nr:hypothetical protein [Candidatus Daviesbacteria bacterium]